MTMPDDDRFERTLRSAVSDQAPEAAPAALRQRVFESLEVAPMPRTTRSSNWLLAAAAGFGVLLVLTVMWPRLSLAPGATPPRSGSLGSTLGAAATTPSPVPPPSPTPARTEPFLHPGLIQVGELLTPVDGWVQDADGHLLVTHSAGAAWRQIDAPWYGPDLPVAVWFLDPAHAWAAPVARDDGSDLPMWRTSDGGATWVQSQIGGSGPNADTLRFLDPLTGYLVTNPGSAQDPKPQLRWAADGGATWGDPIDLIAASGRDTPGLIEFLDRQHGVMVDDVLLHTTDGGRTWADAAVSNTDFEIVNGTPRYGLPKVLDATTALGVIGWTDDNGETAGQTIIETTDGGATWVARYGDARHRFWDFIDASHWIATDGATVWATSDAGDSWASEASVGLPLVLDSVWLNFVDPLHGWASALGGDEPCRGYGCQHFSSLYKTADGGQSWSPVGDCAARFACPTPGPTSKPS